MNGDSFQNTSQKGIWKRFFKMLLKARLPYFWILLYIALSFGLTNVGVSTTEYTAEMFAGNISFSGIIMPFIIFSVVSLVIGTVSGIAYYICTAFIDRNMRRMVWRKVVRLPMQYYDSNEPSELLSRITTDTMDISTLIMQVFVSCITSTYTLYVLTRRIISYDTGLMIAMLVCLPFVVVIPAVLGKFNFGINNHANKQNAELTQEIAEKVNNMETIKGFSNEALESEKGNLRIKNLYRARIRQSWLIQLTNPLYLIAGLIQTLAILLVGRHYYMIGTIDLTEWIAFYAFSATVSANLTSFSGYWDSFKQAQGATNRVTHIMEEPEESLHVGKDASGMHGDIRFDDVTFYYDSETTTLKNMSFKVPTGKLTAIVGPSGSGKSTVMNLVERFYSPTAGNVSIGDDIITDYDLASYRHCFTCITQNMVPVSGTIRDNLLYGIDRMVSDEELIRACKLSDAYGFISEYANGFDEPVTENGKNLSGGQRQKLNLAKIFLMDTPYILLDEATSAMDVISTNLFLEALRREKGDKTILMVAHNRQAVRYADYVVVIENGQVQTSGVTDEVVKTSPFFKTLVEGEDE